MCRFIVRLKKRGYTSFVSTSSLYTSFAKMKNGGPDRSSFIELSNYGMEMGFHRLAIMDTSVRGDQPFAFEDDEKQIYVLCNGEIYNYKELCTKYSLKLNSGSDCEVILHLFKLIGMDTMINELDGEFSFCICEVNKITNEVKLFVGRDQAGTRMLYITGNDNEVVISSELKGSPFLDAGYEVQQFPPRCYLEISNLDDKLFDLKSTKLIKWLDFGTIPISIYGFNEATQSIREELIKSVRSMTMGHRKFCCLLSGGLDSSLVSSILAEYCRENDTILYTFSIGTETSTDKPFAEMVAKHIGSIHYHIDVTEEECLETLSKIPYIIESIDITTNRASCLQYLVVKWISEHTDFKICFCGDGSDEIFTSYRYFHYITDPTTLHNEGVRLVEDIHMYDGLRAGMCATACGLEIRFAFLRKKLLNLIFSIDPKLRMVTDGAEKWILRKAFSETSYLPEEVLWRSKEAFSDGCSDLKRSWFKVIQEYVEKLYSDEELELAKKKYIHMPIVSKESLHYRLMFEKYFGTSENTKLVIPYYWLPRFIPKEFGEITEPSARILSVYKP